MGPTKDSSGNWDILIGQHCTAQLVGIPTGSGWNTTYQCSVSDTTYQTWQPTTPAIQPALANPNASYYVGGPGPLNGPDTTKTPNIPPPGWYWNDAANNMETVSCTATVPVPRTI